MISPDRASSTPSLYIKRQAEQQMHSSNKLISVTSYEEATINMDLDISNDKR